MNDLHPVHNVYDGKFNTYTGIIFDLNNPTPDMIDLADIVVGLSNIVRFGGQIKEPYTVSQHSLLVYYLAPEDLRLEALFHDAAEAYIGDVIKPLKVMLGEAYSSIERRIEAVIFQKFGIDPERVKLIKPYDMQALEIEDAYRYGNYQKMAKYFTVTVESDVSDVIDGYFNEISQSFSSEFDSNEIYRRIIELPNVFSIPTNSWGSIPVLQFGEFYQKGTVNIDLV